VEKLVREKLWVLVGELLAHYVELCLLFGCHDTPNQRCCGQFSVVTVSHRWMCSGQLLRLSVSVDLQLPEMLQLVVRNVFV
jgi:hypothetical protein